ncbi:GNAT family N-acetyltransferase [Hyphococcus flavus]|uniref:GNAT family N-acetyltransferase n=1 Tax=Hyphococcus flavus TaxID=1866326 RepID=A0AAF0CET8_9PROT|nr:GNAT family N-acetyltransferase [Hyphococcus flavus]WDI31811.1 GNAT family N-acetyltransferase [Hyphococcus flavus]
MTSAPVIRETEPTDAETLSRIGKSTFIETFGHLYKPDDLNAFLKKSHDASVYEKLTGDPRSQAWLVEQDGDAIGYASVGPCDLPVPDLPNNAGELQRLYMLEKAHGMGVGTKLLRLALDWLDAHFEHVFVSVYAENKGAQKLYKRHGFEKIHDYFFMVGEHPDPEWIMKRTSHS